MIVKVFLTLLLALFSCYGENFEGTLYTLEICGSNIKCFDPKDPEFGSEGVPFLIMEIKEEAEIVELGKTSNFSGKKIVALALHLQKKFGATSLSLTDTSSSLPCERNGTWCLDEAVMDMKMTSVFINGMSYYETLGAVSDDPEFRAAAEFIHEMPVYLLLSELPQSMIELVKEIRLALDLPSCLTIGDLSKALYKAGKGNEYAHRLWHRFHDAFIAEKNGLFVSFLLKQGCIDPRFIEMIKGDIPQNGKDFAKQRLTALQDKLSTFSRSPALFQLSRAPEQCLANTVQINSLIKNHNQLAALTRLPKESSSRESLFAQWILAKHKIRKAKRFTF